MTRPRNQLDGWPATLLVALAARGWTLAELERQMAIGQGMAYAWVRNASLPAFERDRGFLRRVLGLTLPKGLPHGRGKGISPVGLRLRIMGRRYRVRSETIGAVLTLVPIGDKDAT